MVAVHEADASASLGGLGCASWNSAAEPQEGITQSGASRSCEPLRARRAMRFWDERKSSSENW